MEASSALSHQTRLPVSGTALVCRQAILAYSAGSWYLTSRSQLAALTSAAAVRRRPPRADPARLPRLKAGECACRHIRDVFFSVFSSFIFVLQKEEEGKRDPRAGVACSCAQTLLFATLPCALCCCPPRAGLLDELQGPILTPRAVEGELQPARPPTALDTTSSLPGVPSNLRVWRRAHVSARRLPLGMLFDRGSCSCSRACGGGPPAPRGGADTNPSKRSHSRRRNRAAAGRFMIVIAGDVGVVSAV